MREASAKAPAKVNFTLDILDRRPDGYHELRSIMQTIDLCDTVTIRRGAGAPGIRLNVTGSFAEAAPTDGTNLVCRAVRSVLSEAGIDESVESIDIDLTKRIPSQAGLGGGSSDAAAALKITDSLFDLGLSPEVMLRLARGLGSDVPFFLTGGTCLVEGLGEKVTRLPSRLTVPEGRQHIVLVKPNAGVETALAYRELDKRRESYSGLAPGDSTARWLDVFENGGIVPLANDFEPVIFDLFPDIAQVYVLMGDLSRRLSGSKPLLAGSGSALFCIYATAEGAVAMAQALSAAAGDFGIGWIAAASTCGGDAPE